MKIVRVPFIQNKNRDGAKVQFLLHDMISETEEEKRTLAEMRKKAARKEEIDDEGHMTIGYVAQDYEIAGLGKCVAVPRPEPKPTGEEWILLWSRQAYTILAEGEVRCTNLEGSISESVSSLQGCHEWSRAFMRGESNGKPCIGFFSKNKERALIVTSRRQVVIKQLLDCIFERTLATREVSVYGSRFKGQWDNSLENAEVLTVEVKTLIQAVRTLLRYRNYLDEVGADWSVKGLLAQNDAPSQPTPRATETRTIDSEDQVFTHELWDGRTARVTKVGHKVYMEILEGERIAQNNLLGTIRHGVLTITDTETASGDGVKRPPIPCPECKNLMEHFPGRCTTWLPNGTYHCSQCGFHWLGTPGIVDESPRFVHPETVPMRLLPPSRRAKC